MTRRELVQRVAGAIAVSGSALTNIKVVSADTQPVLAVFEVPSNIPIEDIQRIQAWTEKAFTEAGFPNLRALVICGGVTVTMFDRLGGVCSQQVKDWLASADATRGG